MQWSVLWRWRDWTLVGQVAAATVALALICVGIAVMSSLEVACQVPGRRLAMKAIGGAAGGGGLGCFEFWLNRYQTLISGTFTLIAAAVAFFAVQRQIGQAERLDSARLAREEFAARAVLPLSLAAVTDYAEGCLRELDRHRDDPRSQLELPPFPENAIGPIQTVVRFAQGTQREELTDLIATAQVVIARAENHTTALDRTQRVLDSADLYARAARLFDFARVSMDRHLVSVDDIRKALHLARLDESDWPLLASFLESRERSNEHRRRYGNPDDEGRRGSS